MLSVSERIIKRLSELNADESAHLKSAVDQHFIAACTLPPLVGNKGVECKIAVTAPVSAGKSTLFNALCGYPILPVASKTTSAAPTYISRVPRQSQEGVTVYALKKEVNSIGELTSTHFIRMEETRQSYLASQITNEMFSELLDYMYLATHGSSLEYMITLENVAYFMKSPEKTDILLNGDDEQKWTITKSDYALFYAEPRHRLLLLMVLLCVYVKQNDRGDVMSDYTRVLNERRRELLAKYGFPSEQDYCILLDWCSDDIPENVTLIDLPGTGASTDDAGARSSHTTLVRGILNEADAIWVLCTDNGTIDRELASVLNDVIIGDTRKNKVCIYNCRNGKPNDSGPVIDFLGNFRCLTGERCYVVDAFAGEYKYTQNGIDSQNTREAFKLRAEGFEQTAKQVSARLCGKYSGAHWAYCTFTTSTDPSGNLIVVQDTANKYTLDDFFKRALIDYAERLKYEVALKKAIEQTRFLINIHDSLLASREILRSIDGKGSEILEAVSCSLDSAKREALDRYVSRGAGCQSELAKKLSTLSESVSGKLKPSFEASLAKLIDSIKKVWSTLEQDGHPNRLEASFFGNYVLKEGTENRVKYFNVSDEADGLVTISAFEDALKAADGELTAYHNLLRGYVGDLKSLTLDFKSDYLTTFIKAYNEERDKLCMHSGEVLDKILCDKFDVTGKNLINALDIKLTAMTKKLCDSFDELTAPDGIFERLRVEIESEFRDRFCENILDGIRSFLNETFTSTERIFWFIDHLEPGDLKEILNKDFSYQKRKYTKLLSDEIDAIYGVGTGGDKNFPSNLTARTNKFTADRVVNGALPEIENTHANIILLISFGAGIAVDLTAQINELTHAIGEWRALGTAFDEIDGMLVDHMGENANRLRDDFEQELALLRGAVDGTESTGVVGKSNTISIDRITADMTSLDTSAADTASTDISTDDTHLSEELSDASQSSEAASDK